MIAHYEEFEQEVDELVDTIIQYFLTGELDSIAFINLTEAPGLSETPDSALPTTHYQNLLRDSVLTAVHPGGLIKPFNSTKEGPESPNPNSLIPAPLPPLCNFGPVGDYRTAWPVTGEKRSSLWICRIVRALWRALFKKRGNNV